LLDNAAKLDAPAYRRDFGQAWGSVHGTLAHLLVADSLWWARWHGDSPQKLPDGAQYTSLPMIREAWKPFMVERRAWIEGLSGDDLTRIIEYKNTKGRAFSHPLWWLLYQVVNHGTDHRSHLSIMMTEVGFPPPQLDFIAFVRL
jgi:uncharacterized damage-inducible protein DinB